MLPVRKTCVFGYCIVEQLVKCQAARQRKKYDFTVCICTHDNMLRPCFMTVHYDETAQQHKASAAFWHGLKTAVQVTSL
jgi:hypothetical protein